jgi:hypothetical protein
MTGRNIMLQNLGKFIARLVDLYELTKWRSVNVAWRDAINGQISRLRTVSLVYSICFDLLYYDRTIYNEFWYKRLMINQQIVSAKKKYLNIKLPVIRFTELDLGDIVIPQFMVEWYNMPDEYYVLLSILEDYPSCIVKPLELNRLEAIVNKQFKWLEQIILTMQDDSALDKIVLFIPICSIERDESINYICYANVIDTLLEDDFPHDQERFMITDDLAKLDETTQLIKTSDETQYIPRNIASGLSSFAKLLIKNISQ